MLIRMLAKQSYRREYFQKKMKENTQTCFFVEFNRLDINSPLCFVFLMNRDEGLLDMRWSSIDFKFHDFMRVSTGASYTLECTSSFFKNIFYRKMSQNHTDFHMKIWYHMCFISLQLLKVLRIRSTLTQITVRTWKEIHSLKYKYQRIDFYTKKVKQYFYISMFISVSSNFHLIFISPKDEIFILSTALSRFHP